jgi:hypothetical protein
VSAADDADAAERENGTAEKQVEKQDEKQERDKNREQTEKIVEESETGDAGKEQTAVKGPSPLSLYQMYRRIAALVPEGWLPLQKDRAPLVVLLDVNNDSYDDAVSLLVQAEEVEDAAVEKFSDFSRIYDPEERAFDCKLQLFIQASGRLAPSLEIDLGKRLVFEDMTAFSIHADDPEPMGVSVAFQTSEGSLKEWFFFSADGHSRLTLRETFSIQPVVRDIDGDKTWDVLFFEKGYEEGTGYETYITWYKWDGDEFREYAVVNVLRNLKEYLTACARLLTDGQWDGFISYGLSSEMRQRYRSRVPGSRQIVTQLFSTLGSPELEQSSKPITELEVKKLIYPDLLENPFQKSARGEFIFPLRVRVIAEEGEFVYGAYILMDDNPFENQQFTFIMGSDYVHH